MRIEDQIFEELLTKIHSKQLSWQAMWTSLSTENINGTSDKPYRGANQFILAATRAMEGYQAATWHTFKQCQALGGTVKKGEKGTKIVFFSMLEKKGKKDKNGDPEKFGMWRVFTVFNHDQTTLPAIQTTINQPNHNRINLAVEGLVVNHMSTIESPHISATNWQMYIPFEYMYESQLHYVSTFFHESIHWSGRPEALNRETLINYRHERASEEVIAELGAVLLGARNGFHHQVDDNNVAYIQSWLKETNGKDLRSFLSQAQKAADYVQERLTITYEQEQKRA